MLALLALAAPASAGVYDLVIEEQTVDITGRARPATLINGSLPGPLLRWREDEEVTINVTNRLDETTSIHWHGLLVPAEMDGVPELSFDGIAPGETFTYRFTLKQSGTYWYHSHSGTQEQSGMYGALVIEPAGGEPYRYDKDYVVFLSDWTDEDPDRVFAKLKKRSDYYNFNKRTVGNFFRDVADQGWSAALSSRLAWGRMRMDPTDIADVTGATYTFLINGSPPADNWTALFEPGERVRLRFINGSAMTYYNLRMPGLKMTVVQADGQDVQPVTVDEFQIAVAETYDVIVEPEADRAYTIFAEAMDRSGYARGTLAPRSGMSAPVPELRPRPLRTMADMGMDMAEMGHGATAPSPEPGPGGMAGMDHGAMAPSPEPGPGAMPGMDRAATAPSPELGPGAMPGMDHGAMAPSPEPSSGGMAGMDMGAMVDQPGPPEQAIRHGPDTHGPANAMVAEMPTSRLAEPGTGLETTASRVLAYADLRSQTPAADQRPPGREIELHLTGSMERFIWSIDGKKYSESEPVQLRYGERVRFTLVNDTMMEHPMHLHGMFSELENGAGAHKPRKHTINVKPGERLSFDVTADALGEWAFHCHLLYHMEAGMFRKVAVAQVMAEARP